MVGPLRTAATNQNLIGPISPLQQRRSLDSARENCALEATSFCYTPPVIAIFGSGLRRCDD
jgi:hypothetical protein